MSLFPRHPSRPSLAAISLAGGSETFASEAKEPKARAKSGAKLAWRLFPGALRAASRPKLLLTRCGSIASRLWRPINAFGRATARPAGNKRQATRKSHCDLGLLLFVQAHQWLLLLANTTPVRLINGASKLSLKSVAATYLLQPNNNGQSPGFLEPTNSSGSRNLRPIDKKSSRPTADGFAGPAKVISRRVAPLGGQILAHIGRAPSDF